MQLQKKTARIAEIFSKAAVPLINAMIDSCHMTAAAIDQDE
ncbi:MAG: hypothetical protein AAGF47_07220 [Planctomycetota bacterium]